MGVTLKQIAEEAGVSQPLVTYALNGKPGVSEANRQRIVAIARKMGYPPHDNRAAKALAAPAPTATQKCRVWTASYGGQKAMIIKSQVDKVVNYTVLDVNEGAEARVDALGRWAGEREESSRARSRAGNRIRGAGSAERARGALSWKRDR